MANPNISAPAALIGEPTRAAILMALCDGRAHAAGALADALNISPQSASNHLTLLVEGGLLTVVQQGRHRYFRLASDSVAQSIETLASIAAPIRASQLHNSRAHEQLCLARCCYSHLAGALGVTLLEALLHQECLVIAGSTATGRTVYGLSGKGRAWIARLGLPASEPQLEASPEYAVSCIDWTERRSHLAGLLGSQLLRYLMNQGMVEAGSHKRSLNVTRKGMAFFLSEFHIDLDQRSLRQA